MPTFEFIAKSTVGAGGTSSVTLNNIPQSYDDLRIIVLCRATVGANNLYFRFNNNSTSSGYVVQFSYSTGSGATVVPSSLQNNAEATAVLNQSGYDAGTYAPTDYLIPSYRINGEKTITGTSSQVAYTSTGLYQYLATSTWSVTGTSSAPITSITVFPSSGSLDQYTSITLYGIKNT